MMLQLAALCPSVADVLVVNMFSNSHFTKEGVVVIKAQQHRSQEQNREEALNRLRDLILSATAEKKMRKETRPSRNARKKRVDEKTRRGKTKTLRAKVTPHDQ